MACAGLTEFKVIHMKFWLMSIVDESMQGCTFVSGGGGIREACCQK